MLDYSALNLYEMLKSGGILCKALNKILEMNDMKPVDINIQENLFAYISNLSCFISTIQLIFGKSLEMEAVALLQEKNENSFIIPLFELKEYIENKAITPKQPYLPSICLNYDHLSTMISMLTANAQNPVIAYDPRVTVTVQDIEAFQTMATKFESLVNCFSC